MTEISLIYDQLLDHEAKSKHSFYPIHKQIDFKGEEEDLVDWIISKVEFSSHHNVLDAGCGTGNTLFKLFKEKGTSGLGISLSIREIEFAENIISKGRFSDQLKFRKKSYDENLNDLFDRIIAIESLKHSNNIEISLRNLADHLSKNGILIVADDFLKASSKTSSKQKKLWNSPAFVSIKEYIAILQKLNFNVQTIDLTDRVNPKPKMVLAILITGIKLFSKLLKGTTKVKLDVYLGGLLLERLYQRSEVTYNVIIANRKVLKDE
jgi:cyclopropane fatty-acyl-phospholipid synthase-like methyltransferase